MSKHKIRAVQQGLVETDPKEFQEAQKILQRELDWHQSSARFQTNDDVSEAFMEGRLIRVTPTDHFRPIARLLNPDLQETYPPFLTKKALKELKKVTKSWHKLVNKLDKQYKDLRVPVTSLTRSQKYQNGLVKLGKFATPHSTHCTGYTFDLDASSYYLKQEDGTFKSVPDPRRNTGQTKKIIGNISKNIREIAKDNQAKFHTTQSSANYNQEITDLLIEAVKKRAKRGQINYVIEFKGTPNRVVHVCVKP